MQYTTIEQKFTVDRSRLSLTVMFAAIACFFNIKKLHVGKRCCGDAEYSRFHDNADFDAAPYKSGRFMLSSRAGKDSAASSRRNSSLLFAYFALRRER